MHTAISARLEQQKDNGTVNHMCVCAQNISLLQLIGVSGTLARGTFPTHRAEERAAHMIRRELCHEQRPRRERNILFQLKK